MIRTLLPAYRKGEAKPKTYAADIGRILRAWDSAGHATVVEAELEAALTVLESNELSNLAHADRRRHA